MDNIVFCFILTLFVGSTHADGGGALVSDYFGEDDGVWKPPGSDSSLELMMYFQRNAFMGSAGPPPTGPDYGYGPPGGDIPLESYGSGLESELVNRYGPPDGIGGKPTEFRHPGHEGSVRFPGRGSYRPSHGRKGPMPFGYAQNSGDFIGRPRQQQHVPREYDHTHSTSSEKNKDSKVDMYVPSQNVPRMGPFRPGPEGKKFNFIPNRYGPNYGTGPQFDYGTQNDLLTTNKRRPSGANRRPRQNGHSPVNQGMVLDNDAEGEENRRINEQNHKLGSSTTEVRPGGFGGRFGGRDAPPGYGPPGGSTIEGYGPPKGPTLKAYGPAGGPNYGPPSVGSSYGPPKENFYGPPKEKSVSTYGPSASVGSYGPPGSSSYGVPGSSSYGVPGGSSYGPPGGSSYGPPGGSGPGSYGAPGMSDYGPPGGAGPTFGSGVAASPGYGPPGGANPMGSYSQQFGPMHFQKTGMDLNHNYGIVNAQGAYDPMPFENYGPDGGYNGPPKDDKEGQDSGPPSGSPSSEYGPHKGGGYNGNAPRKDINIYGGNQYNYEVPGTTVVFGASTVPPYYQSPAQTSTHQTAQSQYPPSGQEVSRPVYSQGSQSRAYVPVANTRNQNYPTRSGTAYPRAQGVAYPSSAQPVSQYRQSPQPMSQYQQLPQYRQPTKPVTQYSRSPIPYRQPTRPVPQYTQPTKPVTQYSQSPVPYRQPTRSVPQYSHPPQQYRQPTQTTPQYSQPLQQYRQPVQSAPQYSQPPPQHRQSIRPTSQYPQQQYRQPIQATPQYSQQQYRQHAQPVPQYSQPSQYRQ